MTQDLTDDTPSGNKPLLEPMLTSSMMQYSAARLQWVNTLKLEQSGGNFADNIFKFIINLHEWKLLYVGSNLNLFLRV